MINLRRGGRRRERRQPRHRSPLFAVIVIAALCELYALALSVAANLAGVWLAGLGAVISAGAIPFLMIGGVYLLLFDRIPPVWRAPLPKTWWTTSRRGDAGWALWYANLGAAVLLIGPPAVASYWHQREFLIGVGTPDGLASILPLAVDGLALRAALTLFRLAHQPASAAASDGGTDTSDDETEHVQREANRFTDGETEPDRTPLPVLVGIPPATVAAAAELIAADPHIGRPALRKSLEVTDHKAKVLLGALRPIRAVEGGEVA
jgi:hypothetical protein